MDKTQSENKSKVAERRPKPPFDEPLQDFPGREEKMRTKPDHGEESYEGKDRLAGKIALITGGDSGIGRAVAIAFAREGADVVISYMPEEAKDAEETLRWIEKAGRAATGAPGDIQDPRHCKELVDDVFERHGQLDVLVNNAAYQACYQTIDEITIEEWERIYRTNLFAMFSLCQASIPRMRPGASIINTASIQAYDPTPTILPYASSKAAIVNFTKGLAKWIAEKKIRVNAVAPGPVWTPLIPTSSPAEKVEKFGGDTLFKRPAQPAELAPLFVFLASDESSYVTGEVVGATGGQTPF